MLGLWWAYIYHRATVPAPPILSPSIRFVLSCLLLALSVYRSCYVEFRIYRGLEESQLLGRYMASPLDELRSLSVQFIGPMLLGTVLNVNLVCPRPINSQQAHGCLPISGSTACSLCNFVSLEGSYVCKMGELKAVNDSRRLLSEVRIVSAPNTFVWWSGSAYRVDS